MKKQVCLIAFILITVVGKSQESAATYEKAVTIVTNSTAFKALAIDRYTLSKASISFINSAYAFYLEDPDLAFIDYDFENYFGEFYQPTEIRSFASLREKRRARHILHVSETVQDHFIIELHSHKRKKRGKYPKFYQGTSYSYLFKKEASGDVRYIRTIKIVNQ
jgi:hypothetical protein